MEIRENILQFQRKFNPRLERFLNDRLRSTRLTSPVVNKLEKTVKEFVMRGGKRIRPFLMYYGYLACNGKDKEAILDASVSIELIHNYLLIHDDIIDRDEFRRGRPTIHQYYGNFYSRQFKNFSHLGISAGILAGDFLVGLGYEALAKSDFSSKLKNQAINKLAQINTDVISGEIMDVFWGLKRRLKQEEILKILEYKTAKYSIEGPLFLGAILANASEKKLKTLSRYAIPLGISFQIQDDILGVFGNERSTGKPIGADIKEGKQTLLIFLARKNASQAQRKIIDESLNNFDLTRKQLEKMREIIIETGSLEYSRNLAHKLVDQTKKDIGKSGFPMEIIQIFINLADYIIKREK